MRKIDGQQVLTIWYPAPLLNKNMESTHCVCNCRLRCAAFLFSGAAIITGIVLCCTGIFLPIGAPLLGAKASTLGHLPDINLTHFFLALASVMCDCIPKA